MFKTQEKYLSLVPIETAIASLLQNYTLVSDAEFQ
jgi:hypothetical protein